MVNAALGPKKSHRLCRNWEMKGSCDHGSSCRFAFGAQELDGSYAQALQEVVTDTYKTKLCKFWLSGRCKYGSDCSYTHGDEDVAT